MWETKGLSQGMSCEIHQDLYGPLRNVKEQRLQKKIQKEKLWDLQPCSSHLGCILVSASQCLISVLKFSSWLQALRWSPRDAGGDAPSVGLPWAVSSGGWAPGWDSSQRVCSQTCCEFRQLWPCSMDFQNKENKIARRDSATLLQTGSHTSAQMAGGGFWTLELVRNIL